MTQFDLARPAQRSLPGGDLKDAIKREVLAALVVYALGRERAITGERLAELVGQKLLDRGHEHALSIRTLMRRCQESVAELIEGGEGIASNSSPPRGYFAAQTVEELEDSLAECEQRARMIFRRRRGLRRVMARMRGQQEIRGIA
jgi:hypothetical protein